MCVLLEQAAQEVVALVREAGRLWELHVVRSHVVPQLVHAVLRVERTLAKEQLLKGKKEELRQP